MEDVEVLEMEDKTEDEDSLLGAEEKSLIIENLLKSSQTQGTDIIL